MYKKCCLCFKSILSFHDLPMIVIRSLPKCIFGFLGLCFESRHSALVFSIYPNLFLENLVGPPRGSRMWGWLWARKLRMGCWVSGCGGLGLATRARCRFYFGCQSSWCVVKQMITIFVLGWFWFFSLLFQITLMNIILFVWQSITIVFW